MKQETQRGVLVVGHGSRRAEANDDVRQAALTMVVAIEPTFEADFTFANDEPFRLSAGGSLRHVTR